jgi:hypothetical protein
MIHRKYIKKELMDDIMKQLIFAGNELGINFNIDEISIYGSTLTKNLIQMILIFL